MRTGRRDKNTKQSLILTNYRIKLTKFYAWSKCKFFNYVSIYLDLSYEGYNKENISRESIIKIGFDITLWLEIKLGWTHTSVREEIKIVRNIKNKQWKLIVESWDDQHFG
jgi:hypothetical protein